MTLKQIDQLILEHLFEHFLPIQESMESKENKTILVTVNDEPFECVEIFEDSDKRKGTRGFIVYDNDANQIGTFHYVRSMEELEYLIEKKLQILTTKNITSPTDMDTIRRRNIKNPFVQNTMW